MKRLGTVLHAVDNILVVRADKTLDLGTLNPNSMIVTKTLRKLGKVKELFGPEKDPYISVRLFKDIKEPELTKLRNERVYLA